MQLNYVLWSLMVAVKNANSTMHKVDTVHDPVFFEGDWDPNLQKE
jgi:hypothetical protein